MSMSQRAVIVVDHGSRRDAANQLLDTVVSQLREITGERFVAVEPAHMELAEPTLAQAFQRCIKAGADDVTVALFFLSPGRHATGDIPRMAEEMRQAHPGLTVRVTGPLAPDRRLAELLLDRVMEG